MSLSSAMRETVPPQALSTALHSAGDRMGSVDNEPRQLDLAASVIAMHRMNGSAIRTIVNRAIELNRMCRSNMAEQTGYDASEITKYLDEKAGRHIPLAIIAYVLLNDRHFVVVDGLAGMVGRETQPKTRDLAAENRTLRGKLAALRTEIDSLLTP